MKKANKATKGRILAAVLIVTGLFVSVFFSITSFTGYIVSEEVNFSANVISLVFFLAAVMGAFFLLRKK